MWKDGHIVDDFQQYLRSKNKNPKPNTLLFVWNPYWAVRGAEEDFNNDGKTKLSVEWAEGTSDEFVNNFHIEVQESYS